MRRAAETHGYEIGLLDIEDARWDIDNVLPPAQYQSFMEAWLDGYEKAYKEYYGHE